MAGAGASQAGTFHASTSIDRAISAARPQNSGRQPASGTSHCTGRVEASMPKEPVISIQELARSCAPGSSQRRKPVSGAIRQALTPTPHRTRAASRVAKLPASEKATQPSTAIERKAMLTFLGPCRSSHVPSGSWVAAKPMK